MEMTSPEGAHLPWHLTPGDPGEGLGAAAEGAALASFPQALVVDGAGQGSAPGAPPAWLLCPSSPSAPGNAGAGKQASQRRPGTSHS